MDPLTIVVDNDKCVEDMCDNNSEKVVSDEMDADMDDLLLVDTDYLQDDVDQKLSTCDQPNNKTDQQVNVDDNENETEFHVNLNAHPLTLETKITPNKLYINELAVDELGMRIEPLDDLVLKAIYDSLSISEDCFDSNKEEFYKKDALHLYGVNDMSTNDVFDYLNKYRPYAIEWINDSSCNVLWTNQHLASFALHEYTQPFESESEPEAKQDTQMNQADDNRDVNANAKDEQQTDDDWESIDSVTDKKMPPAGQNWRVGVQAKNGNLIYIRYAKNTDKKVKGAESRSKYYVKYGNPNYGNVKGLISNSKRNMLKSIFLSGSNDGRADSSDSASNASHQSKPKNQDILKRLSFPSKKKHSDSDNDDDEDNEYDEKSSEKHCESKLKNSKKLKMSMYADDYEKSSEKNNNNTSIERRLKHETTRTYSGVSKYDSDRDRNHKSKHVDLREKLKRRSYH